MEILESRRDVSQGPNSEKCCIIDAPCGCNADGCPNND